MSQHAPIVQVGDLISGRYRVERVLGQGAMGMVVAALHIELDERRAIKFMLPGLLNNPEAVERFTREARACAKLKSKHVATVHDVGRLDDDTRYIVMEYLEGTDLKDLLKLRSILPIDEAVGYLLQACEAIGEAHQLGVVHRDLKPANLYLTAGVGGAPCIKVLDFGIARMNNAQNLEAQDMTATKAMLGSPLYMSPEQIRSSRDVDGRSDIWSLGVVLFRMLVGTLPFQAPGSAELFVKILTDKPPVPSHVNPRVPPAMDEIILRCLERDPAHRFQSVAELVAALKPLADPQVAKELDETTHLWSGPASAALASLTSSLQGGMTSSHSTAPGGTVLFPPPGAPSPRGPLASIPTIQGLGPPAPPSPSPMPHPESIAETARIHPFPGSPQHARVSTIVMGTPASSLLQSPGGTHSPMVVPTAVATGHGPMLANSDGFPSWHQGAIQAKPPAHSRRALGIAIGGIAFLLGTIVLVSALRGNATSETHPAERPQATTSASATASSSVVVVAPVTPTATPELLPAPTTSTSAAAPVAPSKPTVAATTQTTGQRPPVKKKRDDGLFGDGDNRRK